MKKRPRFWITWLPWMALPVALVGIGLVWAGRRALPSSSGKALVHRVQQEPRNPELRRQLALRYREVGEVFRAVEQLEVAVALGDADPSTFAALGTLYEGLGSPEEAVRVLRNPAALHSQDNRVTLSRLLLRLGRFREAAEVLVSPGAASPADDLSRQRVVRTLLLAAEIDRAREFLPVDPQGSAWLALRGSHRQLAGDLPAAVRDLRAAADLSPEDAWIRYLLGRAYLEAGDRTKALYTWLEAARLPEAPVRASTGAARLQAEEQLWAAAAATLRKVEAAAKTDPEYWAIRAQVSENTGQPLDAVLDRGRALFHSGDPWAAEAAYQGAIRRAGSGAAPDLWAVLVGSAEERGDSAAALQFVSQAVERWPKEPYFLRRRAELLLEQNRYREAREMARRLQAASEAGDIEVADLNCRIALESADEAALEPAVQAYASLAPADANPFLLRGEWYQERGRRGAAGEQALVSFREAVRRDPKNPEAHARLGSLLAEMRKPDEAVPELLQALTLAPDGMDGLPSIQLARLYRLHGRTLEAEFHERRYARLRRGKDLWLNHLRLMRSKGSEGDWAKLGELALERRSAWIALCAYGRAAAAAPQRPSHWEGLAAAHRRLGRYDEALACMRRAREIAPNSPVAFR